MPLLVGPYKFDYSYKINDFPEIGIMLSVFN
jgi:hypothetical protein